MVVAYSQNFNSKDLKSQDVSENQAKDIAGDDTTYFQEREIHKNHGAVVSSRFLEFLCLFLHVRLAYKANKDLNLNGTLNYSRLRI